ncbi:hypothetical protein Dda_6662 [Drechslerella dactyloides]|uniref:CCHC-type domain-containing protein n=1 Tax=Drechslerella dactyloides TaxID=74499 RepID=A0AAD6IW01_DREDA|nr:hypothetical protein Dda_6662 [Drechslerella dactyloides]
MTAQVDKPPRPTCSICLRTNHTEKNCYYKHETNPAKISKNSACTHCGRMGHVKYNCWQLAENRDRRPGGFRPGFSRKNQPSGPFVLPPRPGSKPERDGGDGGQTNTDQIDPAEALSAPSSSGSDTVDQEQESEPTDELLLDLNEEVLVTPRSKTKAAGPAAQPDKSDLPRPRTPSLLDIDDHVGEEFQAARSRSPPGKLGPLQSGGETIPPPLLDAMDRQQKAVSFAPIAWEIRKSRSKPVSLLDDDSLAELQEKESSSTKPVTYRSDFKNVRGEESDPVNDVLEGGLTTTGETLAAGESMVSTSSSSESHWDSRQAWAATIDFQYHISSNWEDFERLEELETPIPVHIRNGRTLLATRSGLSRPEIWVGEKLRRLKLVNVLYIPEFNGKVMSVPALIEWGFEVSMYADRIDFFANGGLKAQALRFGDRFIFTSEEEVQEMKDKAEADRLDGLLKKRKGKQ